MKQTVISIAIFLMLVCQGAAFVGLAPGRSAVRASSTSDRSRRGSRTSLKMADVVVEFTRSKKTVKATVGTPLSQLCAKNGVKVKYNCKQGQCATCTLDIDGRYVKACVGKVPSSRRIVKIKA